MNALKALITRYQLASLVVLTLLLAVVLPLTLDIFRLNLVGKYLTYAFVAIGLVMLWGYGGVLSLGQGVFFGLGGYAMAMFLKLEASDPESTKIQSTPGIPDFMDWNQITELPTFWVPFKSFPFALAAVIVVPVLLAWIVSFAMFKRRVGGVYFAIITQAVALILTVAIIGQQGYTGGVNGMTDLRTLLGWDTRTDSAKYILYYLCVALLVASILLCRWIQVGKVGTLLLAMRDKEDRVRFSGYDVANFRIFVFCLAAALSGMGGAMFTLQVGFMSPSLVGIVPSIEMVIYAAVGGRMSLVGAVYGALLVNAGKTLFSETFPDLWLFLMAALFIGVTMAFPMGLAGVWESKIVPWWRRPPWPMPRPWPGPATTPLQRPRPFRAASASKASDPPKEPTMSSTDFALAVEDLTVSFDGFKAIDALTLYIDKNELRVIIGPNGAGKTTLLDLICGKTKASGGSIKFKDQEIIGMPEHVRVRKGIGRKFQTPSIYENLSVFQNLEVSFPQGRSVFGALAFKCTDEVKAKVDAVAQDIGLADKLDTEAGLLSHGQKQWLEIGMLLMQEPELLMLDEPIAGMSARERDLTAELLGRICQNRSVIVIEHDMAFVKKIAHKVTVMHQGKILAEGPMDQVQADPKVIDVYLGH